MSKLVCGIFAGVFTGALAMEILKRTSPQAACAVQEGCSRLVDCVFGALSPKTPQAESEAEAVEEASGPVPVS